MAHWVEVPAHRILVVPYSEFTKEYRRLNSDGENAKEGETAAIVVRDRDRRYFKASRFFSTDECRLESPEFNIFLVEL
jgi:hypothetical protein